MTLTTLAEIAKGGMGSVQMARAEGGRLSGRVMAIKRLNPNVAEDQNFVNMFLDEAWMTSAIESPNVIRMEAWGRDAEGLFLAVELVQGVSLSRLIKESRANQEPFAERTVANIGAQICAGMAAAHGLRGPDGSALGLVHRDLTPGNILVGFDGIVKIADFGIAQAEERLTHTRTGTMKGKPSYMAPEQARGGRVDARADLFAFGVLLFELLAGARPWTGKTPFDILMEVAQKVPPNLTEVRKGVHPTFAEIVSRCLRKKPDERFSSAMEIQQMLDAWRAEKGFATSDQASLSQFVRRNTPKQMKWFQDALRGTGTEMQTFKDLEEGIDEARGHRPSGYMQAVAAPAQPGPAAGQPAQPRPAAGQPAQPGPAAGRPASPNAGTVAMAAQPMLKPSGSHGVPQSPLANTGPGDEDPDDLAATRFVEPRISPFAAQAQAPAPKMVETGLMTTTPFAKKSSPEMHPLPPARRMSPMGMAAVSGPTSNAAADLPLPPPGSHRHKGKPPSNPGRAMPQQPVLRAPEQPASPQTASMHAPQQQPAPPQTAPMVPPQAQPPPSDRYGYGKIDDPVVLPTRSIAKPLLLFLGFVIVAGGGLAAYRYQHVLFPNSAAAKSTGDDESGESGETAETEDEDEDEDETE